MRIKYFTVRETFQADFKVVMILLCVILLAGCNPRNDLPKPDLVPEGRNGIQGRNSYCNLSNDGELIVTVRNQTNSDSLIPTETTVTFLPGGSFTQVTPPIPSGAPFVHAFAIPGGCFNADCNFTIEVDSGNALDESHGDAPDNHETNNVAEGICIG